MRARLSIVAVAIGTVIAALAAGGAGVHAESASTDNGFAKRLFAGDPGKQAKAQLGCSVDCERGGISVQLAGDGKSTKIRLDTIRIWRNNKPEEDGFSLSGGADDRVFRLDRASLEHCRSLVTDRKELAAMRRK